MQIWLTKPHERIDNEEVKKVGCETVAQYVAMLEAEGRKSMGKKRNLTYESLPLCTIGRYAEGIKTILGVYKEIPEDFSASFNEGING